MRHGNTSSVLVVTCVLHVLECIDYQYLDEVHQSLYIYRPLCYASAKQVATRWMDGQTIVAISSILAFRRHGEIWKKLNEGLITRKHESHFAYFLPVTRLLMPLRWVWVDRTCGTSSLHQWRSVQLRMSSK